MSSPKTASAPFGVNRDMFTDVHSFMDNAMAELNRIKAALETNESHHQAVVDKMRKDLDNEVAESREAANHFRYEFDNLVHARCQVVAEGLQAMENNQKYAHNMQQKALNSMASEMKTLRRGLCKVSGRWSQYKQRNSEREQLSKGRALLPQKKSSENAVAAIKKIQAHKATTAIHERVESMRLRLKNAAEGVHGRQWSNFMRGADVDGSGLISFDEFSNMVRKQLKVEEPDAHLRIIFESLDDDQSGQISLDELVEFVADPTVRMRRRIRNAAKQLSGSEYGLEELIRLIDKDNSGQISLPEFKLMCRTDLNLLDSDLQLAKVFSAVDGDGSGNVSVEELLAFMREERCIPGASNITT
mmetsp:Transcript_8213/g.23493  ORF Transcript_8213/g.23493 Transcript_8213/m.23493 type:complete len:359 (-) Transcript_8213:234-1310(-)|eukprot:CAMPEP_0176192826 /NCGR_PEP_ID=MMETSP0121_2-20121125/5170_1 /TAXON_ID=160619 /ORGANISM="Kryptoperidinium foliaceum, Strain CCMP 1326" /LENGTH=358 /DNA_ID=CAMNT_0017531523 /DNA_START=76 /DNA_END=1152 /DNA_ORIENTATION=+